MNGHRTCITVRCYAELNDFLPRGRRQSSFEVPYTSGQSVKDLLEGLGVPHPEVDLLLVNGEPAGFGCRLAPGDRVAAYPVFEAFDVAGVSLVRPEPLRKVRFVLDGHLGRLAAFLRLAGFDCLYSRDTADAELAATSVRERRILLTRDQALLKRREITHAYIVRSAMPSEQLHEVLDRFQLRRVAKPFTRCMRCNGTVQPVTREQAAGRVPPRSLRAFDQFVQCAACGRVYWRGSHWPRLVCLLGQEPEAGDRRTTE